MTMPALSILDRLKDADLASRSVFIRRIQSSDTAFDPHDGEVSRQGSYRGQCHRSRLFSVQDDRRHCRGGEPSDRRQYTMRRWGRPEDMAGVALYLASRASGFVCGSTVVVDGGLATTG